jgi:hypothetical protein
MRAMSLAARFATLLPSRRQEVVTIELVPGDGTSVVSNAAGDQWRVIGDTVAVGSKALVQEGRIVSEAADLDTYNVTV